MKKLPQSPEEETSKYRISNTEGVAQTHGRSQAGFQTESKAALRDAVQDNTLHERTKPECGTAAAVSL